MFKEFRNNFLLVALLGISFGSWSQKDTLSYAKYTRKLVWYSDLGYNAAPIKLKYPFSSEVDRLKLRNNMSAVLGIGFSYRWFALRLGITLPGTLRPLSRYGRTTYYDLGFDFSLKRLFFDVDFHSYKGYTYKNAIQWNDTLTALTPNLIRSDIASSSFSVNAWHFWSDQFKMQAFRGKTAAYIKDVQTFYLKYSVNIHGVGSDQGLIPFELIDTNQSKTEANTIAAFDFGIIPGFAYVKRWNDFQIGAMAGLGAVIQTKFHVNDALTRGFLGLAPRYDIKLIAGYNQPKYFVMLVTDFDNKSIRFGDFVYRQTYYSLKVVGGIRLDKRQKEKKEKAIKRWKILEKIPEDD